MFDLNSWSELDLSHLLLAYRKAKSDCFYERSLYAAEIFTHYEDALPANLAKLLAELRAGSVSQVLSRNVGSPCIFAKRLGLLRRSADAEQSHSYFSNPDRAFDRLLSEYRLVPEFRLVGDFPVEMHVLSALWINTVGHKYDACLSNSAFGSRVRRYGARGRLTERREGEYQLDALGSFEPYFTPYKSWRDGGVEAIRSALLNEQSAIAVTLDFSSYYHNIDPNFLVHHAFLEQIGLHLTDWEKAFTTNLVQALKQWSDSASLMMQGSSHEFMDHGGLPIGLSAVRIITNALLCDFDRQIQNSLAPIYYGRYVDDIFLVLQDPGNISNSTDLWAYVRDRVSTIDLHVSPGGDVEVVLGEYQGATRLRFQPSKQKVFFLQGQSGLDLLNNIAHQIRSLSSERRLMPSLEELDSTASARALAAADSSSEEPDSLRRADGLTLRRLGWSLQLRSVEILARDLEGHRWRRERRSFYDFALAHILRPDKILEQLDYLARLISLAVSLADWSDARRLLRAALSALGRLELENVGGGCKINGVNFPATPELVWQSLRLRVLHSSKEAILRSLPWDAARGLPRPLTVEARRLMKDVLLEADDADIFKLALALREADWAKLPYKEHIRLEASRERPRIDGEEALHASFPYLAELRQFLAQPSPTQPWASTRRLNRRCDSNEIDASLIPFLAPNRPYSAQEIALYRPECVFGDPNLAAQTWGEFVHAVRGVWPRATPDEIWGNTQATLSADGEIDPNVAVIGGRHEDEARLAITSLATSDDTWALGASGSADLSPERYRRLVTIINLAVQAVPKPTHLLLPELSLPERWLNTVSSVLQQAGISLIAGMDYDHYEHDAVSSSAVLVLADERLGYSSSVQIRQQKLLPAPREEEDLHVSHGKTWPKWDRNPHPIYVHNGIYFGVLICSELQSIENRQRFQGRVDWLGVLSWNKDLETFSALIESASLDVHAYIALVNNRRYGDSRVRAPRKEAFARDICRIRGGMNEHLVVVKVQPEELRAQQSRARRWARRGDKYKPAPEGFRISPGRQSTPS